MFSNLFWISRCLSSVIFVLNLAVPRKILILNFYYSLKNNRGVQVEWLSAMAGVVRPGQAGVKKSKVMGGKDKRKLGL